MTPATVPHPLLAEQLRSLSQAAALIPEFRPGHPATGNMLWRWANKGIRLKDGRILKLETIKLCSRTLTTVEAVHRFIAAQNEPSPPTLPIKTPAKKRRAAQRADREWDRRRAV